MLCTIQSMYVCMCVRACNGAQLDPLPCEAIIPALSPERVVLPGSKVKGNYSF